VTLFFCLIQGISYWSVKSNSALRGRRINNFIELWFIVGLGGLEIWVSSTSFQKSNILWPKQPPIEQVLKFQNINVELNSKTWMTLKSSVVIFQALKPLQPQWPRQPQQPQWPQWPRQPHFIKMITHPDGWIIPTTKITNTSSFLRNRSSKIKRFTDIWYPYCQRLWRPAYVIFSKTGWWNSNFQTSWTHYES
jgi:hypothetical protein